MKTIETIVHVTADGKLTLQLSADLPPGDHKVVLVIDEMPLVPSHTDRSTIHLSTEGQSKEHPLAKFSGILSEEEAAELQQAIADEFERVDLSEW
jgi:hypothetical protein